MAAVTHSDRFCALVPKGARVERLGTGFILTEGPVWNHGGMFLLFSDMPGDVRRRWDPKDGVHEVARRLTTHGPRRNSWPPIATDRRIGADTERGLSDEAYGAPFIRTQWSRRMRKCESLERAGAT
jgi:hypothetical protein